MSDFAVRGQGKNASVVAQVDPTHKALRASIRPVEQRGGGSYSIALVSGLMAAGLAAGSPIAAFRWASGNLLSLLRAVRFSAATDATAFAQGSVIFDIVRASAFSVQDTGGGTVSWAGVTKSNARASRFKTSQFASGKFGEIQVATTATLVAGTRTLDPNPFGALVGTVGAVPATVLMPPSYLFDASEPGTQPQEFDEDEGFIIRATVPITGTWKFAAIVDWDEVLPEDWLSS